MKLIVTGAAGRLGSKLVDVLSDQHTVIATDIAGDNVEPLDITDFAATRDFIDTHQPDLVLHPAAWTDVDGCARDPEKAIRVNGLGTQYLATATHTAGAALLYISSNEVFDGKATRPYYEYDVTNPINAYGYSKWVGERALVQLNPRHYIVRMSWLVAHGGRNFIHAILNAAEAGKQLRVVTNEVAHPTYANDLVGAIAQLIETGCYGTYHLVNSGHCSRYDFARYALDRAGFADTPVERISAAEWPRPSLPPVYTPLANLAGASLGITLRPWQQAIDDFLAAEELLKD